MSASFMPYIAREPSSVPKTRDAYIAVRVPGDPGLDGSVLVYLPDGTGLVVNCRYLLHLDPQERDPAARRT